MKNKLKLVAASVALAFAGHANAIGPTVTPDLTLANYRALLASARDTALKRKANLFIRSPPEATRGRAVLRAIAAVDVGVAVQAAARDAAEKRVAGGAPAR